jgi:hypothetical protein
VIVTGEALMLPKREATVWLPVFDYWRRSRNIRAEFWPGYLPMS